MMRIPSIGGAVSVLYMRKERKEKTSVLIVMPRAVEERGNAGRDESQSDCGPVDVYVLSLNLNLNQSKG